MKIVSLYTETIINLANQELKDYANKRIPLPGKSLSEKDEDLLKKVSLIASAVKIDPPPIVAPDVRVQSISLLLDQRTIYNRRAIQKRVTIREENSSR